jgi:hypothetical protein
MRSLVILHVLLVLVACGGDDANDIDAGIDAGTDASIDSCDDCAPGETCVQWFDGNCITSGPHCVTTSLECPSNTCTADCEQELCAEPYGCKSAPSCGGEVSGAFTCYGP